MYSEIRVILVPAIIIAIIVIRRYTRQSSRQKHNLSGRQRATYIERQWLSPVIELLIVGGALWTDLSHGFLPWLAALVGVVAGLPLGAYRGKFMYVRSIDNSHKVVVERNAAEIGILLGLVVLKFIAEAISHDPNSALNLLAVALLGVGLASSVGRVAYITYRHFQSQNGQDKSSSKTTKA